MPSRRSRSTEPPLPLLTGSTAAIALQHNSDHGNIAQDEVIRNHPPQRRESFPTPTPRQRSEARTVWRSFAQVLAVALFAIGAAIVPMTLSDAGTTAASRSATLGPNVQSLLSATKGLDSAISALACAVTPQPAFAELAPLEKKTLAEQMTGNLAPVNTVRGVWRMREARTDGSTVPQGEGKSAKGICKGRLSFKGFVGAGKGTVEYQGCGNREGKGPWLTKPKNTIKGRITLSARWKVNFPDGTSLLYRGDVVQDDEGTPLKLEAGGAAALGGNGFDRPNAHIRGDVFKPVTSLQGTLSEKKIGEFEADLIELPRDSDKI